MYGVVPLASAPHQVARDGEDYAFLMLSRFSEWDPENPLEVFCDCLGTVGCATDAGEALSHDNPRQHLWREWWSGIGRQAQVHKVKAHTSESPR
eukprot:3058306-Pyramimonas_sp.AAC.1